MADQTKTDASVDAAPEQADASNPKLHPQGNAVKNPEDWVTKDDPMTGAQASYLKTLSEEAGDEVSTDLTKAEASEKIDELRHRTGKADQ